MASRKIKSHVKLRLLKSRIRKRHFESCFGPYPEKYDEFFRWFRQATMMEGDILEFGVASGGTTCLMAQKLLDLGLEKTIHSFDSFQGFSPEEFEASYAKGDVTNRATKEAFRSYEESLGYVTAKLQAFGFSRLVRLHPGFFQQTLEAFLGQDGERQYCFALIDCDLGSSVKYCAETIFERMTPGGVILFDDYASLTPGKQYTAYSPGVQTAVQKFVGERSSSVHGFANGLYHFVK